jgi:hypothetical protein
LQELPQPSLQPLQAEQGTQVPYEHFPLVHAPPWLQARPQLSWHSLQPVQQLPPEQVPPLHHPLSPQAWPQLSRQLLQPVQVETQLPLLQTMLVPHDPPSLQDPPQLLWQVEQVQLETQLPLLQIRLMPHDPPLLQELPHPSRQVASLQAEQTQLVPEHTFPAAQ